MAYRNYGKRNRNNKGYNGRNGNRRRKNFRRKTTSNAKAMRAFAYKLGCVKRGLKNPDSQISASYEAGMNKTKSERKPLY